MATVKPNETSKGGNGSIPAPPPPPARPEFTRSHGSNRVLKSGPLFISSKGIGWTSWKKRWFILTRNSLVFFRSDPNAIPQKGAEVNLTLGGIDLNNSGSVVVKADKKLLTVLFPDGRDGRAFTLKAETSEDLCEWKTALENALAQAPSSHMIGQSGILKSDQADEADTEPAKDNQRLKYLVIGRPVLLALEDVDGSPSFLEKALRFIEDHGFKVEGILRQAADVEDVERRIREYEQGKTEFSAEEDGHIIADCVKYFLRELPSSPVPASCCSALLEACRTDRGSRVNAMRVAICETFPEPNRRLLQRILLMMQHVASHRSENRMSTSAVATCMAPLLLRPLLAGECEIDTSVNVGDGSIQHAPLLPHPLLAGESEIDTSVNVGDGSIQLLKAAAAVNHAQAIVITLLEEYDNIFREEGSMTPGLYSDSDDYDSEDEEVTDDDDYEDDEQDYSTEGSDAGSDAYTDGDLQNGSSETCTESSDSGKSILSDTKGSDDLSSSLKSPEVDNDLKVEQKLSSSPVNTSLPVHDDVKRHENFPDESNISLEAQEDEPDEDDVFEKTELENKLTGHATPACMQKSSTISNGPTHRRAHMWGRTSARKNLSMETIDFPAEEFEIQKLEACKIELQNKISEEVEFNATLQIQLEKRKMDLRERRLALEQDLQRLQEQLQKERDKRALLESILDVSQSPLSDSAISDEEEMKEDLKEILQSEADVANLTQSVNDLGAQLDQRHVQTSDSALDSSNQPRHASSRRTKRKDKQSDVAAAPTSQLGRSSSKDTCANITESEIETKYETTSAQQRHPHENPQLDRDWSSNSRSCADRTESETEKKYESTSSQQKHLHKNPQLDPARSSNSRSSASADPKKSGTRSEERRSQIASELQNLDKGWGHNALTTPDKSSGSEMGQSQQSTVEGQSSEVESVQNRKSARGSEGRQSMPKLDKGKGSKSSSRQKSGKSSSRQNSGKK